jgi:hypothetical protein
MDLWLLDGHTQQEGSVGLSVGPNRPAELGRWSGRERILVIVYPRLLTPGHVYGIAVMASFANAVLWPRLERKQQRRLADTLTGNVARYIHGVARYINGLANRDPGDVQQGGYACASA